MHFKASTSSIAKIVSLAQTVAKTKSTTPILTTVLLSVEGSRLTVTATDLDISLEQTLAVESDEDGSICAPAHGLAQMLGALGSVDVEVRSKENHSLEIKSGRTKAKARGLPGAEYPTITIPETSQEVDAQPLLEAIRKTAFACSSDETRYNLTGVYVDGGIYVATDGHRLAKALGDDVLKGTIPASGLRRLAKMAEGHDVISVGQDGTLIAFGVPGKRLCVRTVDGIFPDYGQVIPKTSESKATVNRLDLIQMVKRVSVITSGAEQPVKLSVGESIVGAVTNPDAGEMSDEVACELDGPAIECAANAKYLLESLAGLDAQTVTLGFTDALAPIKITADGEDTIMVVMPMRV